MDVILETAFQGIVTLALMTVIILLIGLYIRVRIKVSNRVKSEKQEPKIGNLDNIQNEVVVMRPLGNSSSYSNLNTYWPLLGVIAAVVAIGYVWLSSTEKKHEIDVALAAQTSQEQAKTQERKQREAFYEGMNQQVFNNQEEEAENARIAWENYNEAQKQQKVNEILAMERQSSNNVYHNTPAPTQSKVNSYWKCTDNTGVTTYSVEPCNIEAKQPQQNASLKFVPTEKEIRIVDTHRVNVIHNPTPAPKVIAKTVVVYRNADSQPSLNKMNSLDCQNAKRAYKFEKGSYFGKSFNKERITNDVLVKCGGWPNDLG